MGAGGCREQTQPPGRMGWNKEAVSEFQPSSQEFRAGLLSHLGNVGLGRGIRLRVSCEGWTDMSKKAMTKVIIRDISAEFTRGIIEPRFVAAHPTPARGGLWLRHSLPSSGRLRLAAGRSKQV